VAGKLRGVLGRFKAQQQLTSDRDRGEDHNLDLAVGIKDCRFFTQVIARQNPIGRDVDPRAIGLNRGRLKDFEIGERAVVLVALLGIRFDPSLGFDTNQGF